LDATDFLKAPNARISSGYDYSSCPELFFGHRIRIFNRKERQANAKDAKDCLYLSGLRSPFSGLLDFSLSHKQMWQKLKNPVWLWEGSFHNGLYTAGCRAAVLCESDKKNLRFAGFQVVGGRFLG